MFKKCLYIMVVVIFALSAIVTSVQAAPTCDNQMEMESGIPCNMPCDDQNSQSDDDNCCKDGVSCTSVSVSAMMPSIKASSFSTKETKYPFMANESVESFSPESLKSPPKRLS